MAVAIKPKVSHTGGAEPTTSDLVEGEIAINTSDGKLYIRDDSSNIVSIGGGANCTIGESAPGSPSAGDLWWDSTDTDANLKIYYTDGDSTSQWVTTNVPAIQRTYTSEAAPAAPYNGDLWWDTTDSDGQLKIYYTDADGTSQWVTAFVSGFYVPGSDHSVLFNNSGAAGADSDFTFNDTTNTVNAKNLTVDGMDIDAKIWALS